MECRSTCQDLLNAAVQVVQKGHPPGGYPARPQITPFTGVVGIVPLDSSARKSTLEGWPECPLLRASSEHILIVRAARARRAIGPPLPFPFFNILLAQLQKRLRTAILAPLGTSEGGPSGNGSDLRRAGRVKTQRGPLCDL